MTDAWMATLPGTPSDTPPDSTPPPAASVEATASGKTSSEAPPAEESRAETSRAETPTARTDAYRYRITFAKTIHMRYTSHLDVQRTWERLIRRAELPLLFTQGFHPRARFNLAAALPLGFIGEAEIAELYLVEDQAPDALATTLRASAPPGIRIDRVECVDPRAPAVQTEIVSSDYTVRLAPEVDLDALSDRVTALLEAESVPRERRGKTYDLRPLIGSIALDRTDRGFAGRAGDGESTPTLHMTLVARDGATGRPDEVLAELGLDPLTQLVCRDRLGLASQS